MTPREIADRFRRDFSQPTGTGYVVDCLRSAYWATCQGAYEAVVKAAVSLGHDTDTTACVAGGIAGIRDGVEAIPARWRLRDRECAERLVNRLRTALTEGDDGP